MNNNLLDNTIENFANSLIEQVFRSLNCVKIGKISKFYPEDKTADVEILTKQKKVDGTFQDITILKKCLVIGNKITLPIEVGENVVVLFNDYDLNCFFETGEAQEPYSNRKHDLSDGIVLMGLNSLVNAINYDNEAICLNYSLNKINGNLEVLQDTELKGNLKTMGTVDLGGDGGQPVARVGDKVQVIITSGSSAGTWEGTITSGSDNTKST